LVVDANPLEDVTILSRPERHLKLIMQVGRLIKNELGS